MIATKMEQTAEAEVIATMAGLASNAAGDAEERLRELLEPDHCDDLDDMPVTAPLQ